MANDDERRNHLICSNVQISKKLQKAYLSSILMAESFVKPKLIKQPFVFSIFLFTLLMAA
ncbi:hypothetical protein T09_2053 [Trichinella sp. T9]|nr:hypothetical protein T09_2053 [Trichinella sp. T9]